MISLFLNSMTLSIFMKPVWSSPKCEQSAFISSYYSHRYWRQHPVLTRLAVIFGAETAPVISLISRGNKEEFTYGYLAVLGELPQAVISLSETSGQVKVTASHTSRCLACLHFTEAWFYHSVHKQCPSYYQV